MSIPRKKRKIKAAIDYLTNLNRAGLTASGSNSVKASKFQAKNVLYPSTPPGEVSNIGPSTKSMKQIVEDRRTNFDKRSNQENRESDGNYVREHKAKFKKEMFEDPKNKE